MISDKWTDYEVIATASGEKLERWGNVYLLRPDPQVIWKGKDLKKFDKLNAHYHRHNTGGGSWELARFFVIYFSFYNYCSVFISFLYI